MDRESLRNAFQQRMDASEPLVCLDQVPALKALSNSTRANMANDGRIPVIRNGRRFLTLVSLANEALLAGVVEPLLPAEKKQPRGLREKSDAIAMEKLKAMRYKPIPLDQLRGVPNKTGN